MLPEDKNFFQKVHEVARLIPRGKVTSYGAIARYLGTASSSRMVGWAMNNSYACKPPVPAHRVLNRNGLLTGRMHFNPPSLMEKLLEEEGVKVINNQVEDLPKFFWDPETELR